MQFMELMATLGLDASNYNQGLDAAQGRASAVGGAIMRGVGVIGAASVAAVGAAAAGVVNLTTQAVNSYAEYEQLVGGVNKLYGDASEAMLENAQNAYATAGMDANTYMQTVTSFSASLLNSLDGDAAQAAEIADMAMRDLADNANTFGTMTVDELSNVYTALAKGNYTLLDNLNLGYAGSQEGMLALINDAGIFEQEIDSLDDVSFDQMLMAIHEVQTQFNITGTTANEAASTISGSMGMLESAWANLITGLGDSEADLSGLISNVVDSALTVIHNITPVAQQAMQGIANLLTQLAPILRDELPELINTVLPALLEAVTAIIESVAQALPEIARVLLPQIPPIIQSVVPVILSLIPSLISIGGEVVGAIITGIVENAPDIAQAGLNALQQLINAFSEGVNGDGMSQLVDATMQIVEMIGNFLIENAPTLITAATELIVQLVTLISEPSNMEMLIELSLDLIMAIANGLVQAMPMIAAVIPQIIGNSIQVTMSEFPRVLETITLLLGDLAVLVFELIGGMMGMSYDEIVGSVTAIGDYVNQSFDDFITGLTSWISDVTGFVGDLWTDITGFFTDGIVSVGEALAGWWDELSSWFGNLADNALIWAGDMIDNFVDGLMGGISRVGDAVSGIADEVRAFLGFSEPERGPLSNFHTFAPDMIDLWNQTLEDSMSSMDAPLTNVSGRIANDMTVLNSGGAGTAITLPPIVVQAYFGNEKFDEYVVDSNQRTTFISGGRA